MKKQTVIGLAATRDALAKRLADAGFKRVALEYYGMDGVGELSNVHREPSKDVPEDLYADLAAFSAAAIAASNVDWQDEDGGGCTVTFDLEAQIFDVDIFLNVVRAETEFKETVPLKLAA